MALINPAVNKLPPVILPDPERLPPDPDDTILPPVTLPVALTTPAVKMLPPTILAADVMFEVADIRPPVRMLPPVMLPTTLNKPALSIVALSTSLVPNFSGLAPVVPTVKLPPAP